LGDELLEEDNVVINKSFVVPPKFEEKLRDVTNQGEQEEPTESKDTKKLVRSLSNETSLEKKVLNRSKSAIMLGIKNLSSGDDKTKM